MTAGESARDRAAKAAWSIFLTSGLSEGSPEHWLAVVDAVLAEYQVESLAEDDSPWGSANLTSCGGPCCRGVPAGRDFRDYGPSGERARCGCRADDPDCECAEPQNDVEPSDDELAQWLSTAPIPGQNVSTELKDNVEFDINPTQDTALAVLRELVEIDDHDGHHPIDQDAWARARALLAEHTTEEE